MGVLWQIRRAGPICPAVDGASGFLRRATRGPPYARLSHLSFYRTGRCGHRPVRNSPNRFVGRPALRPPQTGTVELCRGGPCGRPVVGCDSGRPQGSPLQRLTAIALSARHEKRPSFDGRFSYLWLQWPPQCEQLPVQAPEQRLLPCFLFLMREWTMEVTMAIRTRQIRISATASALLSQNK